MFNHGYHPNPSQYGVTAEGISSRPGDYYRALVAAYAELGFFVIAPDYRGHNSSEGADFTQLAYAANYYTRDVIAAYWAATKLSEVDTSRVFMAGHSMGGGVTQRAVYALGLRIQAASIWSTSADELLSYRMTEALGLGSVADSRASPKPLLDSLLVELKRGQYVPSDLAVSAVWLDLNVPLIIQHARHDQTTPVDTSIALAAALYLKEADYELYLYDRSEHLFDGATFGMAIDRDWRFFQSKRRLTDLTPP